MQLIYCGAVHYAEYEKIIIEAIDISPEEWTGA